MNQLTPGLRFRVTREISYTLPATKTHDVGPEWKIPAGTTGTVRINGREVGYYFDRMNHPWGGPAPTIAKPLSKIPDWMETL